MTNETTNSLIYQLSADPELLKLRPELFQQAVIEFLVSLDLRLAKIENHIEQPLINNDVNSDGK